MLLRRYIVALYLVLLAGCTVGPDYHRPEVGLPAAFKEAWLPAEPADALPRGPWWTMYDDPVLTDLVNAADAANQTIRQADAAYRAAAAVVGVTRATLLPTVGVSASSVRSSTGAAAANIAVPTVPVSAKTRVLTSDKALGNASWELDLWGQLRRQLEASRSNAEASASDLAAARLSIAATVVRNYVQLRALDVQYELLSRTVTAYQRSLDITKNRYDAGVAANTDVTQAEVQLATAQAQSTDTHLQRATLEHAIAVLTGRPPEALSIVPSAALPVLPQVPKEISTALLQRRPDVAAAERRVQAANAEIGVAHGAFFPSLSLTASSGYQGSQWANLFNAPNQLWSFGPSLAATLFNGGKRLSQNTIANANHESAVAAYRQTVLAAVQSVDDALSALNDLALEESADTRAAIAAHETLRATENQYRAGTVSYLNVVIAQSTALSADNNLINVQSRRLQAHAALLTAMGGNPSP
jgi:NodT family efflux transporter outer membrane factor (OMF) lipoprotein